MAAVSQKYFTHKNHSALTAMWEKRTTSPLQRQKALLAEELRPVVNGFILALAFALSLDRQNKTMVLFMATAAVYVMYNIGKLAALNNLGVAKIIGLCLLFTNIVIFSGQRMYLDGLQEGLKEFVCQSVLCAMSAGGAFLFGNRTLRPAILTLSLAFIWFSIINVAAGYLGFQNEDLLNRTVLFESRYSAGGYRYQTALYSAWQVSGMLRWAIPQVIAVWWLTANGRKLASLVILTLAAIGAIIAALVEYRAAVFPLAGLMIWILIRGKRARAMASVIFLGYAFAAPVLFGLLDVERLLPNVVPSSVISLTGRQKMEDVVSLSGRSQMWRDGISGLLDGHNLFIGEGHVLFDAIPYLTPSTEYDPNRDIRAAVITKLSFHQGLIDILYIYGVVIGAALVAIMVWTAGCGFVFLWRRHLPAEEMVIDDLQLALLSLGLIGLSNCHDGFFLAHNFFYAACVIACCAISYLTSKEVGGRGAFAEKKQWTQRESSRRDEMLSKLQ